MDLIAEVAAAAPSASALTLLSTALLLGIRHGIDWDHIAAITDITSTTATADAGDERHDAEHGPARSHITTAAPPSSRRMRPPEAPWPCLPRGRSS